MSQRVQLTGRLPDGTAVKAQVAVFAKGTRVFQATVIGTQWPADAPDTFFSSLRLARESVDAGRAHVPSTLKQAAPVFLAFAFAYFLSALLRAVTATLAPVFSAELGLQAATWACWPAPTSSALPRCSCRWAARWTASGPGSVCWRARRGGAGLRRLCAGAQPGRR